MQQEDTRALASEDDSKAPIDGRLRRSERSRQLIGDALFELIGEGDLSPSAQRVADRAGLGIRTVFRLFADMDALYATVDARLRREIEPLLSSGPDLQAPMAERAEVLVADRTTLFEQAGVYLRSTVRHRSRSAFLSAQYRKHVARLRRRLLCWFPELQSAPAALIDALEQATSFEAWDRLRTDQRLSRARARAAVLTAVQALLASLEDVECVGGGTPE